MNEQLRQRAQEIADEHCNDAYSVALAMLEEMSNVKAEAVLDYEKSLSSFDWTAEQYIANMIEGKS